MTGVAEHDGKQEREGDDGEDGRVGLAVTGNPIRVNQFLKVSIFLITFHVLKLFGLAFQLKQVRHPWLNHIFHILGKFWLYC